MAASPGGSLPGTRRIIEDGWGATAVDAGSTSEMYPFQTSVGCTAGTGTHLINNDMLVVRGSNIFPSAVETALRTLDELGPEFQIRVRRSGALDEIRVHTELAHDTSVAWASLSAEAAEAERLTLVKRAESALRLAVNIKVPVELLAPDTLPETTFKARAGRRRAPP
ncbi:MAG TPA: hypothetical protein VIQ30_11250 [Pseudonocardia sp.]